MGIKAVFREQETLKSGTKMLLGNKGKQGKFCWEQGNMDPPGGEYGRKRAPASRSVLQQDHLPIATISQINLFL